jgi:hypothetical protein
VASTYKYEVVSGLSDGDRVAVGEPGARALRDGMEVRVQENN